MLLNWCGLLYAYEDSVLNLRCSVVFAIYSLDSQDVALFDAESLKLLALAFSGKQTIYIYAGCRIGEVEVTILSICDV